MGQVIRALKISDGEQVWQKTIKRLTHIPGNLFLHEEKGTTYVITPNGVAINVADGKDSKLAKMPSQPELKATFGKTEVVITGNKLKAGKTSHELSSAVIGLGEKYVVWRDGMELLILK